MSITQATGERTDDVGAHDSRRRPAQRAKYSRRSVTSVGLTTLFVLITIPYLYPFLFLVATALKRPLDFQQSATAIPRVLTWSNLSDAWTNGGLNIAVLHSFIAVVTSAIVTGVVASLGAFWFLRHHGKIATTLRLVLIGTLALPAPVFIIPLFVMLSDAGLTDNLFVLGLVYGGANARFGVYLLYEFYSSMPSEILEAAKIDGASLWKQFTRIMMPISRPALATLLALSFVWAWGDLLTALVLTSDPTVRTATVAISALVGQYNTGTTVQAAGVVIALLPMVAVFLVAQRFLTRGITSGAVK